jgi:choline kinase
MISKLQRNAITSFIVICGHMQEMIEAYIGQAFPALDVSFVRNEHYLETNTGYSLLRARAALNGGGFVKLDGDVMFDEAILQRLMATPPAASVVCVDHSMVNEEVIKVICHADGSIARIGNRIAVVLKILVVNVPEVFWADHRLHMKHLFLSSLARSGH